MEEVQFGEKEKGNYIPRVYEKALRDICPVRSSYDVRHGRRDNLFVIVLVLRLSASRQEFFSDHVSS